MPEFLFFPYFGPGRRSDRRVIEIRIKHFDDAPPDTPASAKDVAHLLQQAGVIAGGAFPDGDLPAEPWDRYAALLARTALWLQQQAGHRVTFTCQFPEPLPGIHTALVEYDDTNSGLAAANLAIELFLRRPGFSAAAFKAYCERAGERVLSPETLEIINALGERDIPYLQLERDPFPGQVVTGSNIRRNGLLGVGQGQHSELLDGTFCKSRADKRTRALLGSIEERGDLLRQLGVPRAQQLIADSAHLSTFQLLLINGSLIPVGRDSNGRRQLLDGVHSSIEEITGALSEALGHLPFALELRARDLSGPLDGDGPGAVDFDLAPRLDEILDLGDPGLLKSACRELVRWLFPEGERARVPIAAVTGTNGKTTTSRMLAGIFSAAGLKPGLVCTDGTYANGRLIAEGDRSAFIGHARVLTEKSVDSAVLEAHHRGLAVRGFAFDRCDVAACLNVTNDHLEKGEIETVEQMAEIKRSLLERATEGVALNADNAPTLNMHAHLDAKRVCLFSSSKGASELSQLVPGKTLQCHIDLVEGEPWVVIEDSGSQHILPVAEMPCTMGGAARYNLENAMAAISTAYLADLPIPAIRRAMSAFRMGHEHTPGRLNHYPGLPFDAIIDFAHNPDGILRLSEFAREMKVSGRRLLMFSGPGDRRDEALAEMAESAAGSFDCYVCRSYPNTRGRPIDEVPAIFQRALLEKETPPERIVVEPDAERAIDRVLSVAQAGDLVVLTLSRKEFAGVHAKLAAMQQGARAHASQ